MVVAKNRKIKNSIKKKVVYWGCRQSGYVKKNYSKSRIGSASDSKLINRDTSNKSNIVSLSIEDNFFWKEIFILITFC